MLGAIYVGLSGMNAYTKGLQTISNNVANMNTLGFKATTVNFTDAVNSGQGRLGSSYDNGQQRGAGVRFGTPQINFNQGDLRASSEDLDLAIDGAGFLMLKEGDHTYYVRTGQFVVDEAGYISQSGTERRLAVYGADGRPAALTIDGRRTSSPAATTRIVFSDNLSSTGTEALVSSINVYNSNGGKQVWQVKLTPVGPTAPGEWNVAVTDQTGKAMGSSKIRFIGGVIDSSSATMTITDTPVGASPLSVVLDFSTGVTSFSSGTSSSLRASSVNGNAMGNLSNVTIDSDGKVKLTYSNSKTEVLGAVVIADFPDPQQLKALGQGLFEYDGGGQARLQRSGADGIGKLVSKQLEGSNVDLSQQFGDLILIQRGFQASSQVVSISNDMIQQLFGIRGQG